MTNPGPESLAGALAVLSHADADAIGSAFYGTARFDDATRERLRRNLADGLTYKPGLSPKDAESLAADHERLLMAVSTASWRLGRGEVAEALSLLAVADTFAPRCHTAHHPSRGTTMEPCAKCGKPLSCGPFQHGCLTPGCSANPGKCLMCGTSRVHCVC